MADDNTDGVDTDEDNSSKAREQPSLQAINEVESNHETIIHVNKDKVKRRSQEMTVEENAAINERTASHIETSYRDTATGAFEKSPSSRLMTPME